jgi:hypothetical protein
MPKIARSDTIFTLGTIESAAQLRAIQPALLFS